MLLSGPFEKFVEASPVTVMMRGIIENLFHPERLDRLFEENAVTQYTRTLPFSTIAEVMGEVVFNVNPSVGASLQERVNSLPVSTRAFYQKLNGVEPEVAAVLVRDSVRQLAPVIRKLGLRTPLLPGYNIRILDGNHFAATEHRILETRGETAAPLPGQALTVLDPDLRLAIDVFPCEDGHSQERSLLWQVLLTVCARDLWIADRNFCTLGFLFGIAKRKGRFLIRHHASMPVEKIGRNTLIGDSETGRVFEQTGKITDPETGRTMTVRCVTVKLKTATRDGEREIVILTNLPKKDADAMKVAGGVSVSQTLDSGNDVPGDDGESDVRDQDAGLSASCRVCILSGVDGVEWNVGDSGGSAKCAWRRNGGREFVFVLSVSGDFSGVSRDADCDSSRGMDDLSRPDDSSTGVSAEATCGASVTEEISKTSSRPQTSSARTNVLG